ncbi:MAG: glycosyltransferase N-terminal domain-containing protein [Candidatus Zixiibacteriota bacterium]
MLWFYKTFSRLIYWSCYLYAKGRADGGSKLWKGRLGILPGNSKADVWLHAASVGEVKVAGYLIDYLLKKNADLRIHITTMTQTGYDTAVELYTNKNTSFSFFPIDTPAALERTVNSLSPGIVVITETEIWPNFICELSKRGIPVVLVNARMTEKALGKYKWIRPVMKKLLNKYERFFYKTEDDSKRYLELGVDASRGEVVGDMKFDAPLLERTESIISDVRSRAGVPGDAFLFVAGSTRPGEEAIIANVHKELSFEHKNLVTIIAPRHIERADEIKQLLDSKWIPFRIYGADQNGATMILVDRLGLLNELYLAANLAFVGGTLVDIGGHNILEPVWAGCPVLFGPSLYNVNEAAEYIRRRNYGGLVRSEEDLLSVLKKCLSGDIIYSTKRSGDLKQSATATAGDFILEKMKNA